MCLIYGIYGICYYAITRYNLQLGLSTLCLVLCMLTHTHIHTQDLAPIFMANISIRQWFSKCNSNLLVDSITVLAFLCILGRPVCPLRMRLSRGWPQRRQQETPEFRLHTPNVEVEEKFIMHASMIIIRPWQKSISEFRVTWSMDYDSWISSFLCILTLLFHMA